MLARLKSAVRDRLGIGSLERRLQDVETSVSRDLAHAWKLLDGHEDRLGRIERLVRVATVMAWVEQATVTETQLISVVLPTRDRAAVLGRAIESVLGQRYGNWELLVCDDGSTDETAAVVEAVGDPRVRYLPDPAGRSGGSGAARNRGIEAARGQLIAYIDDDNRMHPLWLKCVAWAFEQRPDTEVLYGGIVIDNTGRLHLEPVQEMPSAWMESYDRDAVVSSNIADMSAIAHRAGLPEAHFDEELHTMGDWDLFLRLTAGREPLTLPAIACFYFTDAENRMSDLTDKHAQERPVIQSRGRRARERT
jgi:glycosyltransferase involved in cell wall biosynthesis